MSNQPDIAVDLRTIKGKLHFSIRTGLIDADDVNSLIHWLQTVASLEDHPGRKPTIAAVPLTVPWVDPAHDYGRWERERREPPPTPSWDMAEIDLLAALADGKPYRPKTDRERTAINQLLLNGDIGREPDGRFIITAVGIESLRKIFEPYDVTVKYRDRALSQPVDTAGTVSPDAGTATTDTVSSG